MVVTFGLVGFTKSEPRDGRREFSATLTATNLDTGVVYDNTAATVSNPLLMRLRELGRDLVIKQITCKYEGAAAGRLLQPTVYTSADTYSFLRTQVTLFATDKCDWSGLHIPVEFEKVFHYLMRMTVTNYAATDDMTVTIHGEVF